jgi:hypothetical protein
MNSKDSFSATFSNSLIIATNQEHDTLNTISNSIGSDFYSPEKNEKENSIRDINFESDETIKVNGDFDKSNICEIESIFGQDGDMLNDVSIFNESAVFELNVNVYS